MDDRKIKVGKESIKTRLTSIKGKPQFLFSGDIQSKSEDFMWLFRVENLDKDTQTMEGSKSDFQGLKILEVEFV